MPDTKRKNSTGHAPFPATVKFSLYAALPGFLIASAILLAAFPEASASLIFYLSLGFSLGVQPLAFYGYKKIIVTRIEEKKIISNDHLHNAVSLGKGVVMSLVTGLSATSAGNDNSPSNALAAEWAKSAAGNSEDPAYVASLYQNFTYLFLISLTVTGIILANKAYRPDETNECSNYFSIKCAFTSVSDPIEMIKEFFWFIQQCRGGAERQALLDDNDHSNSTALTRQQPRTNELTTNTTDVGMTLDLPLGMQ
jgi:hypothetical protein